MSEEVNSFNMNTLGVLGSDREVFNRRIIFDLKLKAKFLDLRKQPGFSDKLRDENYTNSLVEQLLAEFREEKQRFNEQEEQYKRERIRQELLLSVTSTQSIQSILTATAPDPMTDEYKTYMAAMIADSLRSEASSMTKSELQKWKGLYPGHTLISGLEDEHNAKETALIAKLGKLPGDLTGGELDRLDFLDIKGDIKSITNDLKSICLKQFGWPYDSFNVSV